MPVLTATGSWLFDFQARMRAVWRHDVFRRRVIRQKNGADTPYTLHTSRSSGDLLLTNEELRHFGRKPRQKLRQNSHTVPQLPRGVVQLVRCRRPKTVV